MVLENLADVAHCHEEGLARSPKLEGRAVLRFVIDSTGAVLSAAAIGGTLPDPAVHACIARRAQSWRFPPPAGGRNVTVTYPFNLQAPE